MAHATETIAVQPVGGREGSGLFSGPVKLAVGGAVVVAALAYFAFMAFQSATVYYYTVGELQERGATAAGETVRVSGKLVDGSFSRDTDSTLARFALTDGATDLRRPTTACCRSSSSTSTRRSSSRAITPPKASSKATT